MHEDYVFFSVELNAVLLNSYELFISGFDNELQFFG